GLARAAQADTALLPLEMRPAADQARGEMLQLREFDLQLALEGSRSLGEDVEDQTGAIEHATAQMTLEIALLHRAQRMVEQHEFGAGRPDRIEDLVGLAGTDEQPRIGAPARTADRGDRLNAGGDRELGEFLPAVLSVVRTEIQMNED